MTWRAKPIPASELDRILAEEPPRPRWEPTGGDPPAALIAAAAVLRSAVPRHGRLFLNTGALRAAGATEEQIDAIKAWTATLVELGPAP